MSASAAALPKLCFGNVVNLCGYVLAGSMALIRSTRQKHLIAPGESMTNTNSSGDDMEQLVHEALNLVVRARKLDNMVLGQACVEAGSYHPDHTNCGTPHLWLMDQYDTDLSAWEAKAKNALQGTGRKL